MSIEDNKALVRRCIESLNKPDWADYMGQFWAKPPTEEDIKQHAEFRAAFAGYHYEINEMIAEGDKVVVGGTVSATHVAEFPYAELKGIPATGKKVEWDEVQLYIIADGKIADFMLMVDGVSRLQQLGVLPNNEP